MLPSFYVSNESPVQSMKNCLFIRVNKEGEQAIHASGLLTFCRAQIANALGNNAPAERDRRLTAGQN